MKKISCVFLGGVFVSAVNAAENPFFQGYENQVAFNFGVGTNHGFLISPPTQFVPFVMLQVQYSQPASLFRLYARQSVNIIQTIGFGDKYGWRWEKYTIPIAMLSEDVILASGNSWYAFTGIGVGFQAQQNERIGSKLLFGFRIGAGYRLTECTSVELFMQHMSNGNTAPENNSYALYGLSFAYNF